MNRSAAEVTGKPVETTGELLEGSYRRWMKGGLTGVLKVSEVS